MFSVFIHYPIAYTKSSVLSMHFNEFSIPISLQIGVIAYYSVDCTHINYRGGFGVSVRCYIPILNQVSPCSFAPCLYSTCTESQLIVTSTLQLQQNSVQMGVFLFRTLLGQVIRYPLSIILRFRPAPPSVLSMHVAECFAVFSLLRLSQHLTPHGRSSSERLTRKFTLR